MIKAVIFDFGQTLVDSSDGFRAAEKMAERRIFDSLHPSPESGDWDGFLSAYRRLRTAYHQRSDFSRLRLWWAVFHSLEADPRPGSLERWELDYWETVKANTRPFPETINVLENLAPKFQLGLITNTQGQKIEGAHRIALFPDLEKFFDPVIVAGEAGMPPKPDPEPFEACIRGLGIAPSEAVYVGDDYRIDIQGADNAGLHPVWLKHHLVGRSWPEVDTAVPVIKSLEPLLDLKTIVPIAPGLGPGAGREKALT